MEIYKQRSTYDCMLACIATAIQKPYEDLWPEDFKYKIEEAKGTYGEVIDEAFKIAGLSKNTDYWTVPVLAGVPSYTIRSLLNGRRAILQVRSLNYQGAGHFVYWAGETLYDPSNKQVYQWLDQFTPEYIWIFDECNK